MTIQRSTESWDTDLNPDMLRRLSPSDKGRRVLAALTRKVFILERWALDGPPNGGSTEIPHDRAKLRRWRSPVDGLWSWHDPAVDDPNGRNKQLMERFASALITIERRGSQKGDNIRRDLDAALLRIASLEKQNLRLLDENRRLQLKVATKAVERT